MIFGLFKKNEAADVVFKGGRVYTLDPDAPWAEAVACKDGHIMAVGDENIIDSLMDESTKVFDLHGGVILPGFIDTCGHPVLQAFQEACLILYDDMPFDLVLSTLKEYIASHPEKNGYFGYGFSTSFLVNKTANEMQQILDEICSDKPIALLDISGFEGWFNTEAMEQVQAAMKEETGTPVITLSYILHVLAPIDFDKLQQTIIELAHEFCTRGYTTVFDCGAPDYLHAIYQEMLIEMLQDGMLKQRFRGSLLLTRSISPTYVIKKLLQKRTSCAEISEFINCRTLKMIIDTSQTPTDQSLTVDLLRILAIKASDNGFDIHLDAVGKGAVAEAFEAAFLTRAAGYKKAHFTIAHSYGLSQQEKTELLLDNDLCESVSTLGDYRKKYRSIESAKDVSDAIDKLTIDAAVLLGISEEYGSIEEGKRADFVIFDENPFDCNLPRFRALGAVMTVINGDVVYDAKKDVCRDWIEIIKTNQQAMQKQIVWDEEAGSLAL